MPDTSQARKRRDRLEKRIDSLTKKQGHPPTVRELAVALDRKTSNVHQDLLALRSEGRVSWLERKPRTLRVVRGRK